MSMDDKQPTEPINQPPGRPSPPTPPASGEPKQDKEHRSIVFPLILIALGVLLLASNFGWIDGSFWTSIWQFWPVVLVLIGIEIIVTGRGGWGAVGTAIGLVGMLFLISIIVFIASPVMGWTNGAAPWQTFVANGSNWNIPFAFGESIRASGNVITEEKNLRDFTGVDVSGPFEVEINRSDTFTTEITADDNLMEHVVVSLEGQRLRIYVRNVSMSGNLTLKAKIGMPSLRTLYMDGATNAVVQGFDSSQDLNVRLSGISKLRGNIRTGETRIEASGASKVDLEGATNNLILDVSGASRLNMPNYTAQKARARVSGASGVTVHVVDELDVEASGASSLTYSGDPTVTNQNVSGASNVKRTPASK